MRRATYLAFAGLAAICVSTGLAAPAVVAAQTAATAQPPVPSLDQKAQGEVVEAAAKALIDKYIYPDQAATAAALIRDNLLKGRYAALNRDDFAKKLTDDLRSVTHDKHLVIAVDGAPPPLDPASGAPPPATMFGFVRADRLKGNIGYVRLDGFHPAEMISIVADELMPKLATTEALIIDMRENHGGDPAGVSRLISFFVAPGDPVHVNDLIWRKPGTNEYTREAFRTSATEVSYRNKPVYVLTSAGTFSGGEEFSYDMQVMKLATLIGETTGGGANPGGFEPLGSGLSIFVPSGRGENPITKTSWEGTGVKPDVATPASEAFAMAYAAASKATHKVQVTAATPDAVSTESLLVLRTEPYPQGEAYIRRQIDGLVKGEQPFDIFSPTTAEALKGPVPADLQAMMKALGPPQSFSFVRVDPWGSDEYDVTFAKGAQMWILALDRKGKIVFTFFRPK